MRKIFAALATSFILLLVFFVSVTYASEGTTELESTTEDNYKCFVLSILTQKNIYHVTVTCRNLIYPAESDINRYILWTKNGNTNVKLGNLGIGKAVFDTKTAFSQLFVTLEKDDKVKSPSNRVVMSGSVKDIYYFDENDEDVSITEVSEDKEGSEEAIKQDQEVQPLSTKDKLIIGLKRSGIIAAIALVGLIGLIFVITRSRG